MPVSLGPFRRALHTHNSYPSFGSGGFEFGELSPCSGIGRGGPLSKPFLANPFRNSLRTGCLPFGSLECRARLCFTFWNPLTLLLLLSPGSAGHGGLPGLKIMFLSPGPEVNRPPPITPIPRPITIWFPWRPAMVVGGLWMGWLEPSSEVGVRSLRSQTAPGPLRLPFLMNGLTRREFDFANACSLMSPKTRHMTAPCFQGGWAPNGIVSRTIIIRFPDV